MKYLAIVGLIGFLFVAPFVYDIDAEKGFGYLSPLKQLQNGTPVNMVTCNDGKQLVYKISDNSPKCVNEDSVDYVTQIGFAEKKYNDSSIEKLWTLHDFAMPESVVYDPIQDVVYVSNIDGVPNEKDGIGYISIISTDGNIIDEKWIDGLNAPKGMGVFMNKLYVADIDRLVEIDSETGKITNTYDAPSSQFLNDVAVDNQGDVYVTDMLTNEIYRLEEGNFEVWLSDPMLENPNGIFVKDDKLIIAAWGVMTNGFMTDIPGQLLEIDIHTKSIQSADDGSPLGNLDGIEFDDQNHAFITDSMVGSLFEMDLEGNVKTLLDSNSGTADLEWIQSLNMIIIPNLYDGTVTAYIIS